jgi:hypothetical protein
LRLLRAEGFLVAVAEKWLAHAGVRQDLFGFIDLVGVHARDGVFLAVQTTSDSNLASRLAKVRSCPEAAIWIRAGGRVECHGWSKRGGKWTCRRIAVTSEDLANIRIFQEVPGQERPLDAEIMHMGLTLQALNSIPIVYDGRTHRKAVVKPATGGNQRKGRGTRCQEVQSMQRAKRLLLLP